MGNAWHFPDTNQRCETTMCPITCLSNVQPRCSLFCLGFPLSSGVKDHLLQALLTLGHQDLLPICLSVLPFG